MDSWIEVYEYLVTAMNDARRRAEYYRQEAERLKDRVAYLEERLEAAGDALSGAETGREPPLGAASLKQILNLPGVAATRSGAAGKGGERQ